jgi:hypothetical protein
LIRGCFGDGGQGSVTPNTKDFEARANHALKPLVWIIPIETCTLYNAVTTKNLAEYENMTSLWKELLENSWQKCQSDQVGFGLVINLSDDNNHQSMAVTFDVTNVVQAPTATVSPTTTEAQRARLTAHPADEYSRLRMRRLLVSIIVRPSATRSFTVFRTRCRTEAIPSKPVLVRSFRQTRSARSTRLRSNTTPAQSRKGTPQDSAAWGIKTITLTSVIFAD